jgi:putative peptide zinc metalloprotease protein
MLPTMPDDAAQEAPKTLPTLRKELRFYLGPPDLGGAPTYNIHDPIVSKYYQVNWEEGVLLQNYTPDMTASDLNHYLTENTTLRVEDEDISSFFDQADKMGLVQKEREAEELDEEYKKGEASWGSWLVHNYLYFKVPFGNPDKFLEKTIKHARFLTSPFAFFIYSLISIAGLVGLLTNFDAYFATFPYFFTFKGAIAYSVTMAVVKIFHECGHAYTAKHYGVRVPAVGLAFLVLQPRLYTDVTDSWKLSNRLHRLHIDAAGIKMELIIAGLATLGWSITTDGILNSIFFLVSSVTLVTTVLMNFNPAMRFDGYYLLSDFLGVDNLQSRAFAYSRWQLRKWFLAMDAPVPEEGIPSKTKAGMLLYSIYTWIYRIILYTGIVLFVYYEFTKILGIILALVEVVVFIIRPFWDEGKQLMALRQYLNINFRTVAVSLCVLGLLFWFIAPLPHNEYFPAITTPVNEQTIYIPNDGLLKTMHYKKGDQVEKGALLLEVESYPLDNQISSLRVSIDILRKEVDQASEADTTSVLIPEKEANVASLEAQLSSLIEQKKQLKVYSQLSGTLFNWEAKEGTYVYTNQQVGKLADQTKPRVIAYVPEHLAKNIKVGEEVYFQTHGEFIELKGRIKRFSPVRAKTLPYKQLSSLNEGPLPVAPSPKTQSLQIVDSYYILEVSLEEYDKLLKFGLTGEVKWKSGWKSKLIELIRYLHSIFWKESGF